VGIALHNYHDVYKYLPPWAFDFNPAPAGNKLGPQTQGHGPLGLILPYLEQGNVQNSTRVDLSVIDPRNWPDLWATAFGVPSAIGGKTTVPVYLCPSSPPSKVDYQPYFTQQLGGLNPGPFLLGGTDYSIVRGYHDNFRNACAPNSPLGTGTDRKGV